MDAVFILIYNHQISNVFSTLKAAHAALKKQLTVAETATVRSYEQASRDVKKSDMYICTPQPLRNFTIQRWNVL